MSERYQDFLPDVKLKIHCALSDAYLRLNKAQPEEALELLKPYYEERGQEGSDDISINFVSPEGLADDEEIATKLYFHLGKILR